MASCAHRSRPPAKGLRMRICCRFNQGAVGSIAGMADVHLLTQSADAEDLVLPSKLTGMLSSGRPIVPPAAPRQKLVMWCLQCGRVVEPGQVDSLAKAVLDLVDQPQACADLGLRAGPMPSTAWPKTPSCCVGRSRLRHREATCPWRPRAKPLIDLRLLRAPQEGLPSPAGPGLETRPMS